MKVVILAGGRGSRLSEETISRPKPLVEIGNMPIIWHIMKTYSYYNFNEFIVCSGYKSYMLKEWFVNCFLHTSDICVDLSKNKVEILNDTKKENWKISIIDTGLDTQTGGRIKRIEKYVNETFMLTYGDGLSNINLNELVSFHKKHGKLATVTAVQPVGRFGVLDLENEKVKKFLEKPPGDNTWINGGFFVLEPNIFNYIEGDLTIWEREPLEKLAIDGELMAYKHSGFWRPMDKLKDRLDLEELWNSGKAPWKIWK